jgi:myo-inositol-1(or 4)-monophosphatase
MEDAESQEIAGRAAFRAGRVALARLGDPGYLRWKGQRDVVSGSVMAVQEAILSVLQKECPGDAILAEEGPEDEELAVGAERLWVVDPICGSQNFVQGIPFFAVSVGLRVNGQLRVGVVYDPVRDERFEARYGEPATLNGRDISIRTTAEGPEFWEQSYVGTDIPHSGTLRDEAIAAFELLSQDVLHHVVMGSPALSICYVAAGRLHVYWALDARPWDVAAAGVIALQAGATISDAEGGSWLHSGGSYVVGTPNLQKHALRGLKRVRSRFHSDRGAPGATDISAAPIPSD